MKFKKFICQTWNVMWILIVLEIHGKLMCVWQIRYSRCQSKDNLQQRQVISSVELRQGKKYPKLRGLKIFEFDRQGSQQIFKQEVITDQVGGSSAKPEVSKQSKEKRLKHKVSGYKSQSKRRSIAGCRLLLRTLDR